MKFKLIKPNHLLYINRNCTKSIINSSSRLHDDTKTAFFNN